MEGPDLVNATFETLGGFVVLLNVRRILEDKMIRGFDWRVLWFLTSWGVWNLYYYLHLEQRASFIAACVFVVVDAFYLGLVVYYVKKENRSHGL